MYISTDHAISIVITAHSMAKGADRSQPTADVPSTAAALPLCTAIVIRCSRWWLERAFSVSSWMHRASSVRKECTFGPKTPEVSIAIGMKWCVAVSSAYFAGFQHYA